MLSINHVSVYTYASPVLLHDHRLMVRPRDSHDLRLLSANLTISPPAQQVRWYHDVFGNSVAVVTFDAQADRLEIASELLLESIRSHRRSAGNRTARTGLSFQLCAGRTARSRQLARPAVRGCQRAAGRLGA